MAVQRPNTYAQPLFPGCCTLHPCVHACRAVGLTRHSWGQPLTSHLLGFPMRYHGTSPSTSCRHPPTPSSPPSAAAHSYVLRCTVSLSLPCLFTLSLFCSVCLCTQPCSTAPALRAHRPAQPAVAAPGHAPSPPTPPLSLQHAHSLHPLRGFLLNPSFCWNSRLAAAGCRNARSHPPHAPAHCNVKPLYILYTLQQADGKGAFDS